MNELLSTKNNRQQKIVINKELYLNKKIVVNKRIISQQKIIVNKRIIFQQKNNRQ
jgi:hypothetical protein